MKTPFFVAALLLGTTAASQAHADSLRLHLGEERQSRATARAFRIGLGAQLGSVPDADGHEVVMPGALHLAWTVSDHLAVGIDGLSFASAATVAGDRHAIGGGPFVEGFGFVGERLQPFAQIGVPMQWRFSGDDDDAFGVAPYAGAGARYWFTDWFTVGAQARLTLVASDAWLLQRRVVPEGALPVTAGLDIDFHF